MKRKKIIILFPLEHIAFSPTTLGIYDALSSYFDVTIYCPVPKKIRSENLGKRDVQYFILDTSKLRKIKALPLFFLNKIKAIFNSAAVLGNLPLYDFVRFLEYRKALKQHRDVYDEVIAVDMTFLYLAQSFYKNASFVSLELTSAELPLLKAVDKNFIKSVVVQTKERYAFLFGEEKHTTFFVQNAPVFTSIPDVPKKNNTLLFNGTASPWFGLYPVLRFIKTYPQFSLTFKGSILPDIKQQIITDHAKLIEDKIIEFNEEYMESKEMLNFLAQYEIGFCFYDLSIPEINTFNYRTAPSGKMFAYLAAGVPVVANNLEGLKVVEDFEAGILINDFEPVTIFNAINTIKNKYDFYKSNCYKAAQHYSYDKNVAPFVEFLKAQ